MNAETKVEATPLRKISIKTVHGKIKAAEIPTDKSVKPLMQIIGRATGVVTGDGDYGEWDKLIGNFEAVDLDSGELFSAPECFVPEPYHSMIVQKIKTGNAVAVDFAYEIGLKAPGPDSTVRYEYTTKVLSDAGDADPLAELRARVPKLAALGSGAPQLEDQSGKEKGGKKK